MRQLAAGIAYVTRLSRTPCALPDELKTSLHYGKRATSAWDRPLVVASEEGPLGDDVPPVVTNLAYCAEDIRGVACSHKDAVKVP